MTTLLTSVEEATRSTEEGVKYFVEPAENSLRRAISKRHHIVFGRRGSGKSSLLRKAAADLTVDRRPIAWIDLETFKGHSYPDLLLSVLIKTFSGFREWLSTAAVEPASKTSFWKKLFGSKPTRKALNTRDCKALVDVLDGHLSVLNEQLHSADDAEIENSRDISTEQTADASREASAELTGKIGSIGGRSKKALSTKHSEQATSSEKYRRSKVEFLRRHVMEYQAVFSRMASVSDGDSFLFLDDLYHLRRADQPLVIDYFHSVAKGSRLWLKVGTIRHRSRWYVHAQQPQGMKLGDDADEIDLDLTLEKYALTKDFLNRVLANLSAAAGFKLNSEFLTDGGLDRLVLASGGVARDFLTLFRRAVSAARERGADSPRGEKVGAEDVNVAAGEHESSKRDEFRRDTTTEDESPLVSIFESLRSFCLNRIETNCFLVDKNRQDAVVAALQELVDLKLVHLVRSRVTVNSRPGRIFEAYMLDLSQYAGARKKRGLDIIEFWRPESKEALRKASLILPETLE